MDGQAGTSHPLRLTVNGPPAGTCQITPEEGVPLVTLFEVTCADVIDEDTPLSYSLYVGYRSDALQTVTSPVFEPFTLESGSEADDYWVNITVTITDSLGASLNIGLIVQVLDELTTTEELLDATSVVDPTVQASDEATIDPSVQASDEATIDPSAQASEEPLYAALAISDEATIDPTDASFTEVDTMFEFLYL